MNQSKVHLILSACLTLAIAACGGGQSENRNKWCSLICGDFERCDSATDESDCIENCVLDTAFSEVYWSSYATCVNSMSCSEMTVERLTDCIGDTVSKSTDGGQFEREICGTVADVADRCNTDLDETTVLQNCLSDIAPWFSDEFLVEFQSCFLDQSCDQIGRCLGDLLDRYNIEDLAGYIDGTLFGGSYGWSDTGTGGGGGGGQLDTGAQGPCVVLREVFIDAGNAVCSEKGQNCCGCICGRQGKDIDQDALQRGTCKCVEVDYSCTDSEIFKAAQDCSSDRQSCFDNLEFYLGLSC